MAPAVPYGVMVWFDPATEDLSIRELTRDERRVRLAESVSVSSSDEDEDPWVKTRENGARAGSSGPSFPQLNLL